MNLNYCIISNTCNSIIVIPTCYKDKTIINKKVKRRVLFSTDKRKLKDDIRVAESWDEIERILSELN